MALLRIFSESAHTSGGILKATRGRDIRYFRTRKISFEDADGFSGMPHGHILVVTAIS